EVACLAGAFLSRWPRDLAFRLIRVQRAVGHNPLFTLCSDGEVIPVMVLVPADVMPADIFAKCSVQQVDESAVSLAVSPKLVGWRGTRLTPVHRVTEGVVRILQILEGIKFVVPQNEGE